MDTGAYTLTAGVPKLTVKTPLATIVVGGSAVGKLSSASEIDERNFTAKRDYLLQSLPGDQEIVLTLASTKFDAVLIVLDAADLSVVTQGDGGGPAGGIHNARATFTTKQGHRYLIRATTYEEGEAGNYTLTTAPVP